MDELLTTNQTLNFNHKLRADIPHCHHTPEKGKQNLVHRNHICHKWYRQTINTKVERATASEAAGDIGILCPSYLVDIIKGLLAKCYRYWTTHVRRVAIWHARTLKVYAWLNSLHSQKVPYRTSNLKKHGHMSLRGTHYRRSQYQHWNEDRYRDQNQL